MAARRTGKEGSFYLGVTKIADVFDWTYTETADTQECTIKGETFARFKLGSNKATVTVRRYIQTMAVLSQQVEFAISSGAPVDFTLYLIDANNGFSKIVGQGYVTRGSIAAPHDKATDELEITVDGSPTLVQ